MKDNFFEGLFQNARKIANDILDKAESTLRDVENDLGVSPEDELEDLRLEVDKLEARNDDLEDLVDDLKGALQVLLDGEARKEITLTWTKYNNLRDAKVEIVVTDPGDDKLVLTITQER